MTSEPSFGVILQLSSMARPDSNYSRHADRPIDALARLVRSGQEQGCIRRELDPRRAAEGILAAMLGVDEVSSILSAFGDLARRSEDMFDLIANGLAAKPRRRRTPRRPAPARGRSRASGKPRRR